MADFGPGLKRAFSRRPADSVLGLTALVNLQQDHYEYAYILLRTSICVPKLPYSHFTPSNAVIPPLN